MPQVHSCLVGTPVPSHHTYMYTIHHSVDHTAACTFTTLHVSVSHSSWLVEGQQLTSLSAPVGRGLKSFSIVVTYSLSPWYLDSDSLGVDSVDHTLHHTPLVCLLVAAEVESLEELCGCYLGQLG